MTSFERLISCLQSLNPSLSISIFVCHQPLHFCRVSFYSSLSSVWCLKKATCLDTSIVLTLWWAEMVNKSQINLLFCQFLKKCFFQFTRRPERWLQAMEISYEVISWRLLCWIIWSNSFPSGKVCFHISKTFFTRKNNKTDYFHSSLDIEFERKHTTKSDWHARLTRKRTIREITDWLT